MFAWLTEYTKLFDVCIGCDDSRTFWMNVWYNLHASNLYFSNRNWWPHHLPSTYSVHKELFISTLIARNKSATIRCNQMKCENPKTWIVGQMCTVHKFESQKRHSKLQLTLVCEHNKCNNKITFENFLQIHNIVEKPMQNHSFSIRSCRFKYTSG